MHPSYSQPALIAIGAALGALLRWQLGLRFNPLFAQFAFGTWLANLLGCLLAGTVLGLLLAGRPLAQLKDAATSRVVFASARRGAMTTMPSTKASANRCKVASRDLKASRS